MKGQLAVKPTGINRTLCHPETSPEIYEQRGVVDQTTSVLSVPSGDEGGLRYVWDRDHAEV